MYIASRTGSRIQSRLRYAPRFSGCGSHAGSASELGCRIEFIIGSRPWTQHLPEFKVHRSGPHRILDPAVAAIVTPDQESHSRCRLFTRRVMYVILCCPAHQITLGVPQDPNGYRRPPTPRVYCTHFAESHCQLTAAKISGRSLELRHDTAPLAGFPVNSSDRPLELRRDTAPLAGFRVSP